MRYRKYVNRGPLIVERKIVTLPKPFLTFSFCFFFIFFFLFYASSPIHATTLFSDDFNDNSIDAVKWIEHDVTGDYIQESGNKLNIFGGVVNEWGNTSLVTQLNFTRAADTVFMADVNLSGNYVMYGFKDADDSYSYTNMVYGLYFSKTGADGSFLIFEDGNNRGKVGGTYALNTDYRIAIVLKDIGAKYYIQGGAYGSLGSEDWTLLYDSSYSSESNLKAGFTFPTGRNISTDVFASMDDVSVTDSGLPPTTFAITNQMIAKPTANSVTLLVKTSITSDVTIDYGSSTSYGNTVSSTNQNIHELTIPNLNPSTTYHYRITATENGNLSNSIVTADSTFKTQLTAGNDFNFVIINDMQGGNFADSVSQISSINPDIILTAGDNIAGEYATSVSDFQYRWKVDVFNYTKSLTNHIPLFTALGNHDAEIAKSYYANGVTAYNSEVSMPTSDPGGETYYSFDYGDAHFVMLDGTYTGGMSSDTKDNNKGTIDSTQLAWLQNDLQATTKKWKFVIGHFLIYGSDDVGYLDVWRLSNYAEVAQVLKDNGVIAYFNGHRHVYNRYVKDGIFYVTAPNTSNELIGNAMGTVPYANLGGDLGTIANVNNYNGFTKISVSPTRVDATIYQRDGVIIDSFDLTPANFELSTPLNNGHTNDTTPTLSWNASSDTGSGLAKYQLYIDGSLVQDNINSSATNIDTPIALSNGAHTWYLKAVNNAGWSTQSTSTYAINIDTVATAPSCGDQPPGNKAPWLYGAIAQNTSSVLLYFTETDNPVNKYVLEYGTKSGEYQYGVQDMGVNERNQMTYQVNALSPNTTYYFKVRGQNGCATGTWSNEISAKTKVFIQANDSTLVSSELTAEETQIEEYTGCQTYTVRAGDSFWSIASSLLGDGNKYKEIIEQNKEAYPSLSTSNNLNAGWELKVNCSQNSKQNSDEESILETESAEGYKVKVKVLDTDKKPVEGAKVTIHSKVQEAITDKDGIAQFTNVEPGDHKVLIAYENFEGEQSINLSGDVKEFALNVTVQEKPLSLSPLAYGIISIMGVVIIRLVIYITKRRKQV